MIVKNEEKYLRGCLDSVKDIVQQIVLVDTGSSDATISIAEEYNAEVYQFDWVNDFSAARNFALSKSTGDWILYLDADERLSESSLDELKKITSANEKLAVNCFVKSPDDQTGRDNVISYTRLFRNDPQIKFSGSVHEQIIGSINENGYKLIDSSIEILHLGYNTSKEKKKQKASRNLSLLLNDYQNNPDLYKTFQLAQTYNVLEEYDESTKLFREVIRTKKIPKEFLIISFYYVSVNELRNHNIEPSLKCAIEGLKLNDNYAPLNYLLSKICLRNGDLNQAIKLSMKSYRANTDVLKNKKFSSNDIILNNEEMILYGLSISQQAGRIDAIQFFLGEYSNPADRNFITDGKLNAGVISKLLNKKDLEESEINTICNFTNKGNVEYVISILTPYNKVKLRCRILESLMKKLSDDCAVKTAYAISLMEDGKTTESTLLFEQLLEHPDVQPSVPFYLISIYISSGKYEELTRLIDFSEQKFKSIPEAKAAIDMIKQKIKGILQTA